VGDVPGSTTGSPVTGTPRAKKASSTWRSGATRDEGVIVATGTKLGEEPESDQMRLITARIGQQSFASVAGFKEGSKLDPVPLRHRQPGRARPFPGQRTRLG
jgi:hypothetical protein